VCPHRVLTACRPSVERLIVTVVRCLFTELPEKERVLKKVVRGARMGGKGAGRHV
jgi:hypothetical protein